MKKYSDSDSMFKKQNKLVQLRTAHEPSFEVTEHLSGAKGLMIAKCWVTAGSRPVGPGLRLTAQRRAYNYYGSASMTMS